jgi:alkylated DNA repair dioxygenase AlkB
LEDLAPNELKALIDLGSGCEMRFTEQTTHTQVPLWLAPRSLLLLQGAARYEWQHGIPARKSDLHNGRRVQRGRRVSLQCGRCGRGGG